MKTLAARPKGHDYRKELTERFGAHPTLLRMDYAGGTTEERKPYRIENGVALIGISGVLSNDPYWWDETGYQDIADEVRMAAEDPEVKGIMLCVNSPGGSTDNAFETAGVLAAAAKKKPMWATAMPIAYSAAYLLASKANTIYTPAITGGVGSIGVYAIHFDHSKMLEEIGITPTILSAGDGKTDGNPLEPLSADAKKRFLQEINRLYGEFVGNVASGRGMSEASVVKLGAFLYEGAKAAIGSGLADRAGTLESALEDFAAKLNPTPMSSAASAGNSKSGKSGKGESNRMEATQEKAPPTAAELESMRAEANATGYSEATDVINMCVSAGVGITHEGKKLSVAETAQHFVRAKTPFKEVCSALLKEKASATDQNEIRSGVLPGTAASTETTPRKTLKQIAIEKYQREGLLK